MRGIDLSQFVRVTNTHEQEIVSRFAGEDYTFKPKVPEDIHVAAAQHIFGFGQKDKTAALARLGLVRQNVDMPGAMDFLSKIKFEAVPEIPGSAPGPSEAAGPPGASGGGNPSEIGTVAPVSDEELPAESTRHRRR